MNTDKLIEKVNSRWVDKHNNSWDATTTTKEQALKYSESLDDCRDCNGCSYCSYCNGCSDCRDCSGCSDCREQPEVYTTKRIGSRNQPTIFYKNGNVVYVSCGCWSGTLSDFEKRVNEVYPDGEHGDNYRVEIKRVKQLFKGATK